METIKYNVKEYSEIIVRTTRTAKKISFEELASILMDVYDRLLREFQQLSISFFEEVVINMTSTSKNNEVLMKKEKEVNKKILAKISGVYKGLYDNSHIREIFFSDNDLIQDALTHFSTLDISRKDSNFEDVYTKLFYIKENIANPLNIIQSTIDLLYIYHTNNKVKFEEEAEVFSFPMMTPQLLN